MEKSPKKTTINFIIKVCVVLLETILTLQITGTIYLFNNWNDDFYGTCTRIKFFIILLINLILLISLTINYIIELKEKNIKQ